MAKDIIKQDFKMSYSKLHILNHSGIFVRFKFIRNFISFSNGPNFTSF